MTDLAVLTVLFVVVLGLVGWLVWLLTEDLGAGRARGRQHPPGPQTKDTHG